MFRFGDRKGCLCGLLCVHVEDGLWAGAGSEIQEAQSKLRSLINIWLNRAETSMCYGGMWSIIPRILKEFVLTSRHISRR